MDFLEEYIQLANSGQWEKALPLIKYIVSINPGISTSWFNYGVCLDELGQHENATNSFLKAYELEPTNYGAQYRVFRSLAILKNEDKFIEFFLDELKKTPEIAELLLEDSTFSEIISSPKIEAIIKRELNKQ